MTGPSLDDEVTFLIGVDEANRGRRNQFPRPGTAPPIRPATTTPRTRSNGAARRPGRAPRSATSSPRRRAGPSRSRMAWEGGMAHVVGGGQHHLRRGRQRRRRELRDHARHRSRGARDLRRDAHRRSSSAAPRSSRRRPPARSCRSTPAPSTLRPDRPGSHRAQGRYPLSTVVHEIGHIIGIGHGGPYNSDVNHGRSSSTAPTTRRCGR